MTATEESQLWLADPSVDWRIALSARLAEAPDHDEVRRRLHALNDRLGWPGTPRFVAGLDSLDGPDRADRLVRAVVAGEAGAAPVAAGVHGDELALAAEHQHVDGLGLLAVLSELTGISASSAARGLVPRSDERSLGSEIVHRLAEVAFRPPARVAATRRRPAPGSPSDAGDGDTQGSTYADLPLDRRAGVTDLVLATAQAVVEFNAALGAPARRVALAVGASTVGGAAPRVADDSAVLRMRNAERTDRAAVRDFLRTSAALPSPGRSLEGSASWVTRAAGLGVRVLGPRLGSTVTVSHLGDVTADVRDLRFYPVAGGASAVSLGAATLDGRTHLTARARRAQHSTDGLRTLLELVAARLD